MGDYGADTLRDSIESGWALTGRLAKTAAADMKETVKFFARQQIIGNEWTKAVEVRKINTAASENEIEYPDYIEKRDVFEVTCRYRLKGSNETQFNEAEQDIEDMTEEVRRIVKTVYSPSAGNGVFHTATWNWRNRDDFNGSKPELIRTLILTLLNVISKSDEVFSGFGLVLTFDVSESANMDSAPAGDYVYTEAHNVQISEGFTVTEALYKNNTNGARIPRLGVGRFRGTFSARIFTKKSDIDSTAEKLNRIYLLQANGQHVEAALLHQTTNTEGTPATLSATSYAKITDMSMSTNDTNLVQYTISGRLIKPTVQAVA